MKLPIDKIEVGDRRREDMGDLQGLSDSIAKYGLLHPVVVDDSDRLVAGGRRLTACKSLGWTEVEVRHIGELTDQQLREIELEENLRRKDLTEIEKSRNMVRLAEVKAGLKKEEKQLRTPGVQNAVGRPKEPNSVREIAKEIGVPVMTLQEAKQHVQAVGKYPELETAPKKEAIRFAKKLDTMPPPEREQKLKEVKEQHAVIDRQYKVKKEFNDTLYKVALLQLTPENIEAWLVDLPREQMETNIPLIRDGIKKLLELEKILNNMLSGPRLTAIKGGM